MTRLEAAEITVREARWSGCPGCPCCDAAARIVAEERQREAHENEA